MLWPSSLERPWITHEHRECYGTKRNDEEQADSAESPQTARLEEVDRRHDRPKEEKKRAKIVYGLAAVLVCVPDKPQGDNTRQQVVCSQSRNGWHPVRLAKKPVQLVRRGRAEYAKCEQHLTGRSSATAGGSELCRGV